MVILLTRHRGSPSPHGASWRAPWPTASGPRSAKAHPLSQPPLLFDRKEHCSLLKKRWRRRWWQLREAWLVFAPVLEWYIRRRLARACSLPNPLLLVTLFQHSLAVQSFDFRKQHGQSAVYYCFIFFCKLLAISSHAIIMLPTNFKPWAMGMQIFR